MLSSGPILAAAAEYTAGLDPVRSRRDVLFVDQRGTGRSGVLACPALRGVVPALLSEQQMLARIGACGRQLGPKAGLYGTAAAADDIEAVRAALGLERLDLWGSSYGTYLMTVYAARHPAHVQSLVLHGAYPIDFDPWALDRLAAARRSIGLVCARTGDCRGDVVLRDLAELAARLRAHPVTFTVPADGGASTVRLDEAALASIAFGAGNVAGFGRLPAATASALAGDLAPMRRLVELTLQPIDESFGQAFAQQCHEYPRVFSFGDSRADRRAAYLSARAAIGSRALAPFSAAAWTATQLEAVGTCLEWPNDRAAARPFPVGTRVAGRPRPGRLRRSRHEHPGTVRPRGRSSVPERPLRRDPERRTHARDQPLRGRPRAPVRRHARRERAGVCRNGHASVRRPARAPHRDRASLPAGGGTAAQRRAIAVVVATAADLADQAENIGRWSAANGLRGGHYAISAHGGLRLDEVRVVRDVAVSGQLAQTKAGGTEGTLRLSGSGVVGRAIHVTLAAERSWPRHRPPRTERRSMCASASSNAQSYNDFRVGSFSCPARSHTCGFDLTNRATVSSGQSCAGSARSRSAR